MRDLRADIDEMRADASDADSGDDADQQPAKAARRNANGDFKACPWQQRVILWGQLGRGVAPSGPRAASSASLMASATPAASGPGRCCQPVPCSGRGTRTPSLGRQQERSGWCCFQTNGTRPRLSSMAGAMIRASCRRLRPPQSAMDAVAVRLGWWMIDRGAPSYVFACSVF